jgi:tetratricopeptide (TPR) repeat protein
MKIGKIVYILAILLLIAGFIQPVAAAENETADAGTSFYNAGIQLLNSNEYQRAIELFNKALASDTTMIRQSDALLYTYQGKSYALIQLEKYNDAIQTIDEGLVFYPKDFFLWNNKGYSFFKLDNYTEALKSYDMAISIDQNYTGALINKGDTLYKMGRYQGAVDSYIRANEINPGNSYAAAGLEKAQRALAAGTPPTTAPSQTIIPTTLPANTQSTLTQTIVPTANPANTQSPLSPLPVVAALSLMGILSVVLMKKR